jgi:hypothetical protein
VAVPCARAGGALKVCCATESNCPHTKITHRQNARPPNQKPKTGSRVKALLKDLKVDASIIELDQTRAF